MRGRVAQPLGRRGVRRRVPHADGRRGGDGGGAPRGPLRRALVAAHGLARRGRAVWVWTAAAAPVVVGRGRAVPRVEEGVVSPLAVRRRRAVPRRGPGRAPRGGRRGRLLGALLSARARDDVAPLARGGRGVVGRPALGVGGRGRDLLGLDLGLGRRGRLGRVVVLSPCLRAHGSLAVRPSPRRHPRVGRRVVPPRRVGVVVSVVRRRGGHPAVVSVAVVVRRGVVRMGRVAVHRVGRVGVRGVAVTAGRVAVRRRTRRGGRGRDLLLPVGAHGTPPDVPRPRRRRRRRAALRRTRRGVRPRRGASVGVRPEGRGGRRAVRPSPPSLSLFRGIRDVSLPGRTEVPRQRRKEHGVSVLPPSLPAVPVSAFRPRAVDGLDPPRPPRLPLLLFIVAFGSRLVPVGRDGHDHRGPLPLAEGPPGRAGEGRGRAEARRPVVVLAAVLALARRVRRRRGLPGRLLRGGTRCVIGSRRAAVGRRMFGLPGGRRCTVAILGGGVPAGRRPSRRHHFVSR
mmetsp:Transcript_11352/g.26575  ORF Transcript_11352/g.26575 Transcript_11352/m.26575 type:complete len:511 (-) Transcript_11352:369-1901(-)